MRGSLSAVFGLTVMCVIGLTGCSRSKTTAPEAGQAASTDAHSHAHGHSHAHAHGPHGGHIVELDTEDYHAELTMDGASNRVGIYLLGADAATPAPIEAASVTIEVSSDGQPTQYTLPAVAQPGEPAGKSSYFELVSEPLLMAVAGQSQTPIIAAQLNISVDGEPMVGTIDTQIHGPSHGSDAEDDALVWHRQISEHGYEIALGHHGVILLAGADVEPAVQISRDGQPVADAQVFNALLDADGETVIAEEKATVYEPPTNDEPAHYAQGPLKIPPGTRQAVIRYRIVLPEGQGERTFEVPVAIR